MQINQDNNTATSTSTSTSNAAYKALPTLGYINLGLRVPSADGQSSYQLSPFIGIEVKEQPFKNKLSKTEKELFAAIVAKIKGLEKGKAHKLNLEVEVYIPTDEAKTPDTDAVQSFLNQL